MQNLIVYATEKIADAVVQEGEVRLTGNDIFTRIQFHLERNLPGATRLFYERLICVMFRGGVGSLDVRIKSTISLSILIHQGSRPRYARGIISVTFLEESLAFCLYHGYQERVLGQGTSRWRI